MNRVIDGYCRVLDVPDRAGPRGDGGPGVRQRRAALRLQLRHHGVSEEVSRWLFLWMTFLGAIVALREHGHLGTDTLVSRLPRAGKKICLLIGQVLMLYVTWLLLQGQLGPRR